jgi:hypothetical protein
MTIANICRGLAMKKSTRFWTMAAVVALGTGVARADTVTLSGKISGTSADQNGSTVTNLDTVAIGDIFSVVINFNGSLTNGNGTYSMNGVGGYNIMGASINFSVPSRSVSVSPFINTASQPISITLAAAAGGNTQITYFGCRISSTCFTGNNIGGIFLVPTSSLFSAIAVSASLSPGLHALDFASDGGLNDTFGDNNLTYSYQTTPVPLPAAGWLLLSGLGGLAAMRRRAAVS